MCCDRNCFACKYEDCVNDDVTIAEYNSIKERDKQITGRRKAPNGYYSSHMTPQEYHRMYYQLHKEELNLKSRERYKMNRDRYYAHIKEYQANRSSEQIERDKLHKRIWLREHRKKSKEGNL